MRQPLQSEPRQIGPASGLPRSTAVLRPVDAATIELLSLWQEEDATADQGQLRAAEEDLAAFMKNLNEARTASGEPLVYP
jgi:hypothetical protein